VLKVLEGPVWILIGVIICASAYRTGLGTFNEPGAGFVAFASGLFIITVGTLITVFRRPDLRKEEAAQTTYTRFLESPAFKLTYTTGLLLFYALFLDLLGYIITTFVVLFGLFYNSFDRRWASPLLVSCVSVAVTYLVFEVWLRSQLPRGIFPWW
jgi:hypothetical protein